jgi:hypothetical protein
LTTLISLPLVPLSIVFDQSLVGPVMVIVSCVGAWLGLTIAQKRRPSD